jgi:hypothetical protein
MRRRVIVFSLSLIAGAVGWSCEGDDTLIDTTTDGGSAFDGSLDGSSDVNTPNDTGVADTGSSSDAGDAATVDRGPTVIPFSGDPAGLFWEYGTKGGLYIADQQSDVIIKWTDAAGFGTTWVLPQPQNAGSSLGQLVRELDGTMFVPRAGVGADNTVLWVTNIGDAGDLSLSPGATLDPTVTRSGFTLLPDNTTIDTFFQNDGGGDFGLVNTLGTPPNEKKLVSGLPRPLAVVYNETRLYIADGDLNEVIAISQTGGTFLGDGGGGGDGGDAGDAGADAGQHGRVFAAIDQPSFACAGADGDLFVTTISGTVNRITSAGVVSVVAMGLKELRGIAFDGAAKRVFVAEHDPADAGAQNTIRIYPID